MKTYNFKQERKIHIRRCRDISCQTAFAEVSYKSMSKLLRQQIYRIVNLTIPQS